MANNTTDASDEGVAEAAVLFHTYKVSFGFIGKILAQWFLFGLNISY